MLIIILNGAYISVILYMKRKIFCPGWLVLSNGPRGSICICKALLICNVLFKIPNLPMHNLTFYSLKISPKNCPQLVLGSRTEIKKKFRTNFFM